MSAPKMSVKLHLAKNIDELNHLATRSLNNNYRNTRPSLLYRIARNIYQELNRHPHDDELTYIYACRFLKLLEFIYAKDSDKHFVHTQFDMLREQASQTLNRLRDVLTIRYAELGLRLSPVAARKLSISDDEPPEQRNAFGPAVDGFITSRQFYKGLQTVKEDVLIMDVRPAQLFWESRLQDNYTMINIDDYEIEKGMSAYKFEAKLSEDIKQIFTRRNLYGYIVLMDMDSTKDSFPTSKLKILYDMLTVWDINKKYQRLPYILNGGYMDFIDMYPSLSTNSNVSCAQRYADLDDLLNLDDVVYPPLADKEEGSKPAIPSRKADPDIYEQLERLYKEILYTAEKLYEIEDQIYIRQLDIINYGIKLRDKDDTDVQRFKDNLDFEKSNMEEEKALHNERKAYLQKEIRRLLGKVPNVNEAEYLKRSDLTTVEKATVEISRKRRKLMEEPKKADENKVDPKLEQTPSGDTMTNTIKKATPEPIKKPIKKTPTAVRKSTRQIPRFDRATKPLLPETGTDLGLNGLVNIRNSCYMNSILQCVRHIPALKNFFVSGEYRKHLTKNNPRLIGHLGDLIARMWVGTSRVIRPQEFYSKLVELHPIFGKGHHEDANEFYMLVFNFINEDITSDLVIDRCWAQQQSSFYRSLLYKKSLLSEQFYYQIRSDCTCPKCKQHIHKFDTENIVLLALPSFGKTTMQEMFDEYMSKCDISNLYCKDCEMSPEITRKFTFQPRILTIMFKRYYSDEDGVIRKITTPCSFPMNDFKVGNAFYKLWAVCLHSGTLNAGHYTAACLNWIDNNWYEFNDETVYPIDLKQHSFETAAYMLFYQITDEKLAGFMQA